MADEKGLEATATPRADSPEHITADLPRGWQYKSFSIFGRPVWYASPNVQLLMVSIVCFLCPGMFNALTGLGGGGQVDTTVQADAATATYATFAVVGFFAGTFTNRLGLRYTLSFGGIGYCIYSGSFLSYTKNQNRGFVVFAGAFLGVCAGLLWSAQGAIMMAYPSEKYKGRYISRFWVIFNAGGVVGSLVLLLQNVNNTNGSVTDGTYIALIILMFLGVVVATLMCDADKVIREDHTKVIVMKNPSWMSEFKGLYETILAEPWIILLFPMFFASNIFYTYQNNGLNAPHHNIRTRALNGLLYWLSQIIGAVIIGHCLDYGKIRRSLRAKISWCFLVVATMAMWGGGWSWQKDQASRAVTGTDEYKETLIDWTDSDRFWSPMWLYFFYGMFDAFWQASIYWYMGSLSNSGRKAANLAGFYKGIQSAGAAIYWRLDGLGTEYDTLFISTWAILGGALLVGAPIIFLKIKDTVSLEEDLKFSDETIEDVVIGAVPEDKKAAEV
jgi:MFS family permease